MRSYLSLIPADGVADGVGTAALAFELGRTLLTTPEPMRFTMS